ncbi:MAG: glycoside hydrolase family 43 protein [Bacteroidales bacterium]|nr:glycoside hydrolase family 43 protein [Bacteroidales bacterium]
MAKIIDVSKVEELKQKAISQPIVEHIYTADPSAHVFNNRLYIYPSHDIAADIDFNDNGDHFDMKDYHVLSMDEINGEVIDHGVALDIKDVPWAGRQMWAPDAAHKDGKFYFYFPAKDKNDIFRIGVAVSNNPEGPFKAEPHPMLHSHSIDPAVFEDQNGKYFMYFGGIWGGQLQRYRDNKAIEVGQEPQNHEPALSAKVALMHDNMLEFAEEPRDLLILDENGDPIKAGDHDRRFFEAAWMHKYNGKYYFSYSTGNTHKLCYAVSDNPYGPFTYKGIILMPVIGWTTHHSIVEFKNKWHLFYHDSSLSDGVTHLRSVKFTEIEYDENGDIKTIDPFLIR